jgi:CRP-like cAMP-binding protein
MLSKDELLDAIQPIATPSEFDIQSLRFKEARDFGFVIAKGSGYIVDDIVIASGLESSHMVREGDPIGFGEVLTRKPSFFKMTSTRDVEILQIDADRIRDRVARAGFLAREMIRYNLSRIFDRKRPRPNAVFEDQLLETYDDRVGEMQLLEGDVVYDLGAYATHFFFIEQGQIGLYSQNGAEVGLLKPTECFGEASLLTNTQRSLKAVAVRNSTLRTLDANFFKEQVACEHPLVQLSLLQLSKHLMFENHSKLFLEGDSIAW